MKKHFIFLFVFLTGSLFAQTSHTVIVENYMFTPDTLTINVGDTVVWKNVQGTHNVNGTQATFPNNPASFGNSVGSGWTYQFVFTQAGTYNYQCDPHASSMKGVVIVNSVTTGLSELKPQGIQKIYYSANTGKLHLTISEKINVRNLKVVVYNVLGREVMRYEKISASEISLDVHSLPSSLYVVNLLQDNEVLDIRKVSIY